MTWQVVDKDDNFIVGDWDSKEEAQDYLDKNLRTLKVVEINEKGIIITRSKEEVKHK